MSKIVLITNIPAPYRVDLFYYMQTHLKKHEIHVIYTNENEDNRSWNIAEDRMINSHILHSKVIKRKGMLDKRYVHIPNNIGKTLSEIYPDIVIAWEYNPAALQSLFWTKMHHKKFIHLTDGTLYSERNIGKIQKLTRKIIIKNCDAAIASSTKAKEKLMKWGLTEDKIFISFLTVDIEPYIKEASVLENTCGDKKARMLFVGRITYGKGIDLLFNALPYIRVPYEVYLVGDGSEQEIKKIKVLAHKLKIEKNIKYRGFKQGKALINEYKNADVFVLPTREDCFGLVLLEALCMLKPIVTSKYADGAYDIVVNKKNGIIVDPYNPEEFGRAIEKILTDRTYEESCVYINKQLRNKFTFESVSKGYMEAIDFVVHV